MLTDPQFEILQQYTVKSKQVMDIQEQLIKKQEEIIASLKRQIALQAETITILKGMKTNG